MRCIQSVRWGAAGCLLMAAGNLVTWTDEAKADWKVSPKLSLGVSTRYDDNVASEEDRRTDSVAVLKTEGEVVLERETTRLNLGGVAAIQFYGSRNEFNAPSYSASGGWRQQVTERTRFDLREMVRISPEALDFLGIQQPVSDDEGEEGATITTRRTDQYSSTTALSVSHMSSERTSEKFSYSLSFQGFEDPELIDTFSHGAGFSIQHELNRSSGVSGGYGFRYVDNRDGDDSQTHQVHLGAHHSFSESTSVGGSASLIMAIEPETTTGTAGGGLSLSRKIEKLMTFKAGYTSSVSPSQGLTLDLVRYQTAGAELARTLTRNTQAALGGYYGINRSVSTNQIRIRSWGVYANLGYAILEGLRATLGYRHAGQYSNGTSGSDFQRNQYTAGLTMVFE